MEPVRQATQARPANATLVFSLNLFKNLRALWMLQIAAMPLFFLSGWFFLWYTLQVRTILFRAGFLDGVVATMGTSSGILIVLVVLASMAASILAHELVHGAFFWAFTRARPVFGFRGGYAYAAAPGWYFPRRQYVLIGLAPLVLLSVLGLLLIAVVPARALFPLLLGMVINAAGAVGDLWIVFLVVRERRTILVEDLGDGFNFYALP